MEKQLSKKELYNLKKEQKRKLKEREKTFKRIKKFLIYSLVSFVLGGGIIGGGWFLVKQKPAEFNSASKVISRNGIHWHADLKIKIFGEYQSIPAGIGLGAALHQPIHTHNEDGRIHMEYPALVREKDLRLGKFFEIWGKRFDRSCIFDYCAPEEGKLRMLVNGKENFDFDNYIMKDGDQIEIIFEK